MQLAQHSLELRNVVRNLKSLSSEDFKTFLQSESNLNSLPLSSQEAAAAKRIFSVKLNGRNPDDKIKMGYWA